MYQSILRLNFRTDGEETVIDKSGSDAVTDADKSKSQN